MWVDQERFANEHIENYLECYSRVFVHVACWATYVSSILPSPRRYAAGIFLGGQSWDPTKSITHNFAVLHHVGFPQYRSSLRVFFRCYEGFSSLDNAGRCECPTLGNAFRTGNGRRMVWAVFTINGRIDLLGKQAKCRVETWTVG